MSLKPAAGKQGLPSTLRIRDDDGDEGHDRDRGAIALLALRPDRLLTTIVHVDVGMGLHHGAGVSPLWANGIAFAAALIVSFLGQSRVTFPEAEADGAAFLRFTGVAILGFSLNQAIVWAITGPLDGPYWVGLAIVVTTVPLVTFVCLRYWAFRR